MLKRFLLGLKSGAEMQHVKQFFCCFENLAAVSLIESWGENEGKEMEWKKRRDVMLKV